MNTVIDLAREIGYQDVLPTIDPEALRRWFDQSTSQSLERYLGAFVHTVGVLQTAPALRRAAREAIEDLAGDGVVYAEIRFAPSLHTLGPLDREAAIAAVLEGLTEGSSATGVGVGLIVVAMRDMTDSEDVARSVIGMDDRRIIGFDLAGPEKGYPPDDHLPACRLVKAAGLGLTIHAGEADGPHSIWSALNVCSADRIGHGMHILDDCEVSGGSITSLGRLASHVRDRQVPLELCPTSSLHTQGWRPEESQVGLLSQAGFNVTINTDNRLMSATSMSQEFALLRDHQGFDEASLRQVTDAAVDAAFVSLEDRLALRHRVQNGWGS